MDKLIADLGPSFFKGNTFTDCVFDEAISDDPDRHVHFSHNTADDFMVEHSHPYDRSKPGAHIHGGE
jgi:hypothetical protein